MEGREDSTGRKRRTVVVVDDYEQVRQAVARVIARRDDLSLVGQAADYPSAFELIEEARPDIVVIDRSMPGSEPAAAFLRLRERYPAMSLVLLTGLPVDQVEPGLLDVVDKAIDKCSPLSEAVASIAALPRRRPLAV
jgi:DNA-binding NarL/FixJ family response regulator